MSKFGKTEYIITNRKYSYTLGWLDVYLGFDHNKSEEFNLFVSVKIQVYSREENGEQKLRQMEE